MIKFLSKLFKVNRKLTSDQKQIENYLANSYDLVDLERRQRQISRGEAPWQVQANVNLKGWT
jgi:hypothetical protein